MVLPPTPNPEPPISGWGPAEALSEKVGAMQRVNLRIGAGIGLTLASAATALAGLAGPASATTTFTAGDVAVYQVGTGQAP